ncbi:MAG TPA: helix-hairpin-helix domain-containing protein [Opitutaceae bacterium]|nr:helix-hairpin-helix domain-containing protein [Opitutaceae bacterium]
MLAHFGSIDRLRAASPEQIAEAEGIGPKFAAELHAWLRPPAAEPTPPAAVP